MHDKVKTAKDNNLERTSVRNRMAEVRKQAKGDYLRLRVTKRDFA
jgi:hypothetical protein